MKIKVITEIEITGDRVDPADLNDLIISIMSSEDDQGIRYLVDHGSWYDEENRVDGEFDGDVVAQINYSRKVLGTL